MSYSIPQEDIERVNAQLSENNSNNQQQAQRIAELEGRLSQVSAELVTALSTIQKFTETITNQRTFPSTTPQPRVDALKVEPRKFKGYGDNAKLWIQELENNLESRHYPVDQWSSLAVNFLDEEGRLFWYELKEDNGGVSLHWEDFKTQSLKKYNFALVLKEI